MGKKIFCKRKMMNTVKITSGPKLIFQVLYLNVKYLLIKMVTMVQLTWMASKDRKTLRRSHGHPRKNEVPLFCHFCTEDHWNFKSWKLTPEQQLRKQQEEYHLQRNFRWMELQIQLQRQTMEPAQLERLKKRLLNTEKIRLRINVCPEFLAVRPSISIKANWFRDSVQRNKNHIQTWRQELKKVPILPTQVNHCGRQSSLTRKKQWAPRNSEIFLKNVQTKKSFEFRGVVFVFQSVPPVV